MWSAPSAPVVSFIGQPDLDGRVYGQATCQAGARPIWIGTFLPAPPLSYNTHTPKRSDSIGSVLRSSTSNAVDVNDRRCLTGRGGTTAPRFDVGDHRFGRETAPTRSLFPASRVPLSPMRPMPKYNCRLSGPHPPSRHPPSQGGGTERQRVLYK